MPTDGFYIAGNDLVLDAENCLPKFAKFMDIDTAIRFSAKEITPYLTDYGRSIFGISGTPVSAFKSEHLLNELFISTNDSKDVVLALVIHNKNKASGYYADKKQGIYTPLEGTYDAGQLKLTATDDGGDETAYLTATVAGNRVTAVYEGADGKMQPVVLVRE